MKAPYRLLALVVAVCLACGGACAAGVRSLVHFNLDCGPCFDEPMSRWLDELCNMATITTSYYWGDEGKFLTARLDMGSKPAIELKLTRQSGIVTIQSNLLGSPVAVTGACDWADDMFTYAAFGLKTPSTGSLTPVSAEGLALALYTFSAQLRAHAAVTRGSICRPCENCNACENCKVCDICLSVALFADALATRFDMAPDHNALLIKCDRLTGDAQPFQIENAVPADDSLVVDLIKEAVTAVCEATMGNA